MALLNKAKALSAVALAATAFTALPTAASANDYRCESKNDQAQVIGGLLGAVIGGVVGSEIAGRGDGTEGTVIGAAIGAAAGAGLGDESVKCRREQGNNNVVRTTGYRNTTTRNQPSVVTVAHNGHNSRGHSSRGYSNTGYTTRNYSNRGYQNNGYGYNQGYNSVDRQISVLSSERDDLRRRNRYDRSSWIDRRLHQIDQEIDRLQKIKRYGSNSYRTPSTRGHYHGNSRTVCYNNH